MKLHLGRFGPVRVFGRTLIIVCSYRGGAKDGTGSGRGFGRILAFALRLVTLAPLRRHVGSFRDHYANPRVPDAQLEIVKTLLEASRPQRVKAVFDARLALAEDRKQSIGAEEIETADLATYLPVVRDFDTVVLMYPDALGLSFGPLERRLLAAGAANVVVLTGRRRLFPLSVSASRALRWRRFLASTRITELFAALVIIPLAVLLSGVDKLRISRSRS